jgi:hypothetical protein
MCNYRVAAYSDCGCKRNLSHVSVCIALLQRQRHIDENFEPSAEYIQACDRLCERDRFVRETVMEGICPACQKTQAIQQRIDRAIDNVAKADAAVEKRESTAAKASAAAVKARAIAEKAKPKAQAGKICSGVMVMAPDKAEARAEEAEARANETALAVEKAKAKAARAKETAMVATMAAENLQSMAGDNELSDEFIDWGESEFL